MADNSVVLYEEDVPGAKLTKDPDDCSVEELKRWLQCHGLKKLEKRLNSLKLSNLVLVLLKLTLKLMEVNGTNTKELVVSQKIRVQMFQSLQMIGNNFLLVVYRQCITNSCVRFKSTVRCFVAPRSVLSPCLHLPIKWTYVDSKSRGGWGWRATHG